jgi:hypothetical protein
MCGCPVRLVRRKDGALDHYEYLDDNERHDVPNPIPPVLQDYLRARRKGKKTVALVGSAWSTGPWAPFGEEDVWGMNELNGIPWFPADGCTAWFQIHNEELFTQAHVRVDHWGWLQEEHPFPIYMTKVYDAIPSSVKYPLREIQKALIHNIYRGEEKMKKFFSSTFNYQMALALHQGYERIELYGIEMLGEGEYSWQREMMGFWMGKADAMGVEVWMPETCALLYQPLYGYEEVRQGKDGAVSWTAPPSKEPRFELVKMKKDASKKKP